MKQGFNSRVTSDVLQQHPYRHVPGFLSCFPLENRRLPDVGPWTPRVTGGDDVRMGVFHECPVEGAELLDALVALDGLHRLEPLVLVRWCST